MQICIVITGCVSDCSWVTLLLSSQHTTTTGKSKIHSSLSKQTTISNQKPVKNLKCHVMYKLANRRSLYYATALKAELSGLQSHGGGRHHDYNHNLETAKQNARIVVIGAGLAGLSAAQHLLQHGFNRTLVLEATERYGGRVNSQRFGDTFCELGAKWVNIDGSHDSMYELLRNAEGLTKKLKPPTHARYVLAESQVSGEQLKVPRRMVELIDMLFRELCRGLKVRDRVKTGGDLQSLDNVMSYFQSESERLIGTMFKEPSEQLMARDIFQSLFKDFSSILGCCLEYVNIQHVTTCPLQQESHPIYVPSGLDNIVEQLTNDLDVGQLQMGKPVGQIQWRTMSEPQSVGCMDGSLYQADHIICTLPLGVLKTFAPVLFKPTLPLDKLQAIQNLGFGNPVKIYLSYKRPISRWLKSNLRPLTKDLTVNPNGNQNAIRSWTQQVVEVSQLPSSQHVLEIRVGGGYYDEIEKLPDAKLLEQITSLLRQCLANPRVPYPQAMLRSTWNSSACYLGGRPYFSVHSSARDVHKLAAPLGHVAPTLLFAGDATALQGFGTIDGARSSGIREAQRIIDYYNKKLSV
ncbi:protein anon-37Cs isoform X2 [Drosophila nasuta]|uniref:protein anon-37Cs isoform X2 n=1 Tax=Drosophila nasuta TaxID=42062 RepID=UPI00295E7025|nr:protein anon-37Cs isoform X2 [Drosophila nasuta]